MFEVTYHAEGLFALADDPRFPARLKREVKKIHLSVWRAWAQRGRSGNTGLQLRFEPRAFRVLRLSRRTARYQMRQQRYITRVLPYRSPYRNKVHMYQKMKHEGLGYRIRSTARGENVRSVLTLPGARVLNFLTRNDYAGEFLGFDDGGKRDAEAIYDQIDRQTKKLISDMSSKAPRRRVRRR